MFGRGSGLTKAELRVLQPLDNPAKVQDFINGLKRNFELDGDTTMSPRSVLRTRQAHCVEGALLAAVALRLHGRRALAVELVATGDEALAVGQGGVDQVLGDNGRSLRSRAKLLIGLARQAKGTHA